MQKYLLQLCLTASLFTCLPQSLHAHEDYRDTALVLIGGMLAAGGVYNLCEDAPNVGTKVLNIVTGAVLLGLGCTTIVLSKDIIKEADCLKHRYLCCQHHKRSCC